MHWNEQVNNRCLKNGLNEIDIPDLIIAQNAKQNYCQIYSLDIHFKLIKDIRGLQMSGEQFPMPNSSFE